MRLITDMFWTYIPFQGGIFEHTEPIHRVLSQGHTKLFEETFGKFKYSEKRFICSIFD